MTVDLNELISDCEQMLGLDLEAIAQRIGVDPLELDLAAASRSGIGAKCDAAVEALVRKHRLLRNRRRNGRLPRFRGLDSDALIDASDSPLTRSTRKS